MAMFMIYEKGIHAAFNEQKGGYTMQLDHPSVRKMWKEYLDHAGISRRNDPGHETWYFCDNEKDAD